MESWGFFLATQFADERNQREADGGDAGSEAFSAEKFSDGLSGFMIEVDPCLKWTGAALLQGDFQFREGNRATGDSFFEKAFEAGRDFDHPRVGGFKSAGDLKAVRCQERDADLTVHMSVGETGEDGEAGKQFLEAGEIDPAEPKQNGGLPFGGSVVEDHAADDGTGHSDEGHPLETKNPVLVGGPRLETVGEVSSGPDEMIDMDGPGLERGAVPAGQADEPAERNGSLDSFQSDLSPRPLNREVPEAKRSPELRRVSGEYFRVDVDLSGSRDALGEITARKDIPKEFSGIDILEPDTASRDPAVPPNDSDAFFAFVEGIIGGKIMFLFRRLRKKPTNFGGRRGSGDIPQQGRDLMIIVNGNRGRGSRKESNQDGRKATGEEEAPSSFLARSAPAQ